MTTFYLAAPVGDDGVIHALARMSGNGVIGDARLELRPGDSVLGVAYEVVLAGMKKSGSYTLPPQTPSA